MSWRMLQRTQAEGKHTFLDDMESLVHVVFYCALRYLPHKLKKEELIETVEEYFEKSFGTAPGAAHGGDVKLVNAHDRALFKETGFASEALTEWLTTILTYQRPDRFQTSNYGEQWTPEHIDAFWSAFLRTHVLERDDRLVHDVTRTEFYDYTESSSSSSGSPSSTTSTSTRKRPAERGPFEEVPPTKRRRSLRLRGPGAVAPSSAPAFQGAADGPRRSQRIKTILSRAQPLPVASPRVPRLAPSAARRAPRGRGRGRTRR